MPNIKEQIDTGFNIIGTEPERDVLYDLMACIFSSKTGKVLHDLLNKKKKITLGFYQTSRTGEHSDYDGMFIPFMNQIVLNRERVRSPEARLSTLTHELFHALQYQTGTLHGGFNVKEAHQAFILNELEARFKGMEILNELYPRENYVSMQINRRTMIDCIIYRALQEQGKQSLISAGQKSSEVAQRIANRLARSEMIQSQLFVATHHLREVLGENWTNEFESMNQEWRESYKQHAQNNCNLASVLRLIPFRIKPDLRMAKKIIATRLELPVSVFQKTQPLTILDYPTSKNR